MLAVCIPVYNQDVSHLVLELLEQKEALDDNVSIVVIDDASSDTFKAQYVGLSEKVKIVQLEQNVGRSRIRNTFLEHTDASYLLFIDCDSRIVKPNYLKDYLKAISTINPLVLFGASDYQKETPRIYYRLRWRYGAKIESKNYNERIQQPMLSFKTNNFLIERNTFVTHPFNESITGYGHEDTLFGFELEKNGVVISQIDNPVLNAHLDSNTQFLNKTNEALENLIYIWGLSGNDKGLAARLRVLSFYLKYKDSERLSWFLRSMVKPVRFLLEIGFANLKLFSLYKLCYLLKITHNQKLR
jgi:glycosyltransferase involved in cell wall biosynthesis